MSKLYESQWKATKAAFLSEGRDLDFNFDGSRNNNKKQIMATVLENTYREMGNRLFETITPGATAQSSIATLNKVVLPVLRRVMPTVIAHELIGVQPIQGPVAQIHTLRVQYADAVAGAYGNTAGQEAFGCDPVSIARYYSGDGDASGATSGRAVGSSLTDTNAPGAGTYSNALEQLPGRKLAIQILRQVVQAGSRKLSARWTWEAAQDANSQQGIDIEAEVLAALAQEITAEIDQEILAFLRGIPGNTPDWTYDMNAVTGTPTFVGDAHAAFATLVNASSNRIAQRTRRGPGNWIVVSPFALTILQSGSTSAFARTTEGVFDAPTNTKYVGTLNHSIRVYVDQFADDTTCALVGYKGSETDAAAYYCPYVPLTTPGVIIDPRTMDPVIMFMTRYALTAMQDTAQSLGNSKDYLSKINLANIAMF
jgi:hypothetical protein